MIRNRIYNGRQSGVFVQKEGRGRIEYNIIYGNGLGGVWVSKTGDPKVLRNKIYNNRPNDIIRKEGSKGEFRFNGKAP